MKHCLALLGVLIAAPRVASIVVSDTCNDITLKCKTSTIGRKAYIHLILSTEDDSGPVEDISVGINFASNELYYAKSRVLPFKVTKPDVTSDTSISWYESLGSIEKKKSAKFRASFDVDPCAETQQYLSAYASAGGCDLQVDCQPVCFHMILYPFLHHDYLFSYFSFTPL